jgi:FkbM family methyltransferase
MPKIQTMKVYQRVVGLRGLISGIKGQISGTMCQLKIHRADVKFPFHLRVPSSDVATYEQVCVREDYAFSVTRPPQIIVDAGANIGLASLYLVNRFPDSTIIAIEPEESNFQLLERNVSPYPNIIAVRGALWHEDTAINLVDPGSGKWGFMTQAQGGQEHAFGKFLHKVQGMTIDTIMKQHGIEHIDILKVDIEGAELEVFRHSSSWLGNVGTVIVELHERLKSGCNRTFYNNTNGFDDEWVREENIYLTRNHGCVTRPLT